MPVFIANRLWLWLHPETVNDVIQTAVWFPFCSCICPHGLPSPTLPHTFSLRQQRQGKANTASVHTHAHRGRCMRRFTLVPCWHREEGVQESVRRQRGVGESAVLPDPPKENITPIKHNNLPFSYTVQTFLKSARCGPDQQVVDNSNSQPAIKMPPCAGDWICMLSKGSLRLSGALWAQHTCTFSPSSNALAAGLVKKKKKRGAICVKNVHREEWFPSKVGGFRMKRGNPQQWSSTLGTLDSEMQGGQEK